MSAIFGIYYPDGRTVETEDLKRMSDSLPHRGSDAIGFWSEHSVGFGHRMFWVTPESLNEKLPFFCSSNGTQITITADARLDNREELIQTLGLSGRPPAHLSDSELILQAYQKWGDKCPEKLLGDFAFAVWDKKNERLFCARDHFGIKPFHYYFLLNRMFVFATEIKALFCLPEIPQKLNEIMVADHLAAIREDPWITFYKDIVRLPPAHRMVVERGQIRIERYWSLDPSREIRLSSDTEYEETFRHLFTEAVRTRLRSTFPVGSWLSGGLDSSSIACVARGLLAKDSKNPLYTFSCIFEKVSACDERPYIEVVLAQGGFKPHFNFGDRVSPLIDLDYIQWLGDEPYQDLTLSMAFESYKKARGENVRIILDGSGGDEVTWSSFAILTEFAKTGRWKEIMNELKETSKVRLINYRKKIRILWSRCVKPFIPEKPKQIWRGMRGRSEKLLFNSIVINPQFSKRIGLSERARSLKGYWLKSPRNLREEQYFCLSYEAQTRVFEEMDRISQAFSCEQRYPFWDKRLVEFCLAIPPEQKFCRGWNRSILRRALRNILPEKIRQRVGKADFSPNNYRGPLFFEKKRLEDVIFGAPSVIEPYVNIPELRRTYQRYRDQKSVKDLSDTDFYSMWYAVTLALWLRHTGLNS